MKKWYAKINRSDGSVLKRKEFDFADGDTRVFNKETVWLEEQRNAPPTFNPKTHRIVQTVTQPDLSDLGVPVPPATKREYGYNLVALTAQQIQNRVDEKIDKTNVKMARAVEIILTKIATNNGVALKRSDFPAKVWTEVNARRALRGQGAV